MTRRRSAKQPTAAVGLPVAQSWLFGRHGADRRSSRRAATRVGDIGCEAQRWRSRAARDAGRGSRIHRRSRAARRQRWSRASRGVGAGRGRRGGGGGGGRAGRRRSRAARRGRGAAAMEGARSRGGRGNGG
ncbi:hypothetical protein DAI22_09g056800 [Oryza sativa Japonica Group]|nr:hypothetical protein DAI22_09g056800 [Oryza sativa Japonica Group]